DIWLIGSFHTTVTHARSTFGVSTTSGISTGTVFGEAMPPSCHRRRQIGTPRQWNRAEPIDGYAFEPASGGAGGIEAQPASAHRDDRPRTDPAGRIRSRLLPFSGARRLDERAVGRAEVDDLDVPADQRDAGVPARDHPFVVGDLQRASHAGYY